MGIFGVSAPKFVFDRGGGSETTVLLDFATIVRDEPEVETIRHQSRLDGKRVYIPKGKHWLFDVRLNLYKYGDPAAKYDDLKAYENELVTLWRHRDGEQFKKAGGADCLFQIVEVTAFALENVEYRDAVLIRFESSEFVHEAGSTVITPQVTDITVLTGE